jgi:ABC-type multidrug transport system permease subunit
MSTLILFLIIYFSLFFNNKEKWNLYQRLNSKQSALSEPLSLIARS